MKKDDQEALKKLTLFFLSNPVPFKWLQLDSNPEPPVWPNGWVFVYKLSGSGFESSCSHLNFRFHACFEQGVPWHSGNYGVGIHSETCTWHDKNIQPVTFNGQSYQKQRGSGTSAQSLFSSRNKFRKMPLFVIYYPTKFDDVM